MPRFWTFLYIKYVTSEDGEQCHSQILAGADVIQLFQVFPNFSGLGVEDFP